MHRQERPANVGAAPEESPLSKRTVAGLVTTAVLATIPVSLIPSMSANAEPTGQFAPPVPRVADGLVQGVVTVARGQGQDDVVVVAYKGNRAVASAITYASQRPNGPQHGYFFLNLDAGDYELRFWKRGVFDDTKRITVGRGATISLGEVDLQKVTQYAAVPFLDVREKSVRAGEKIPLQVRVDGPSDFWSARGSADIYEGRELVQRVNLKAKDKGIRSVAIGSLPVGTHQLHVRFVGQDGLDKHRGPAVTVKVLPKKR